MKPIIAKAVFFLIFLSCSGTDHSNKTEKFEESSPIEVGAEFKNAASEMELQEVWSLFAKAVRAKDLQAIKQLSTDCILCGECLTNSPKEDSAFKILQDNYPNDWYDQFVKNRFIPIQAFMVEDMSIIFDHNTLSRLLDGSKISYFNSNHNKKLYATECIIEPSEFRFANMAEIFVTVVDPSAKTEGFTKAFAFIKTKGGYKFCGYSTIP